jgi:hypothetical protein
MEGREGGPSDQQGTSIRVCLIYTLACQLADTLFVTRHHRLQLSLYAALAVFILFLVTLFQQPEFQFFTTSQVVGNSLLLLINSCPC